ncbi:MAG: hypothetical protein R3C32_07945 [Chloroflexota bacterium]
MDAVHLGSTYGIIALVVGRGIAWLIAVPSLLLGIALGLALASGVPRSSVSRPGWVARALTTVAGVVVVGLAVLLMAPATTAPIVGDDGEPVPGSIAELTRVPIGGHEQALMIRGRDTDAPVLLHLAGGPGGTDIGAMRADTGLEQAFVVVTGSSGGRQVLWGARPD